MTRIASKLAKKVTRQSYGKKPKIDGVRLIDLARHIDDGGDFSELVRLQDGRLELMPDFEVRQVNHSLMQRGAIKAWHLHEKQDDVWFVPPDERLLVGLLDARHGASEEGATMRLVLGEGRAQLLFIPRGVAHGAANPYGRPVRIVYFVNQTFNPDSPDELRLPFDIAGADFWTPRPG